MRLETISEKALREKKERNRIGFGKHPILMAFILTFSFLCALILSMMWESIFN